MYLDGAKQCIYREQIDAEFNSCAELNKFDFKAKHVASL